MIRLPGPTERLTVIGRTGTGKTTFAAWALSHASFDKRPWVIFDGKYDPIFHRLKQAKAIRSELSLSSAVPKSPGLYLVHPRPDQDEAFEDLLWRIWERGNTGIFFDEYYLTPDKGALRAILTQGRSKRLPVIGLAQRPVDISRYCLSEASYFACFDITDDRDWKTLRGFCPVPDQPLYKPDGGRAWPPADFNCFWYSVARKERFFLTPVPADDICGRIATRAPRPFWG